MSVNPPEGTLTIENSHLDVKGNVSAVALKLGTLRLTPSYGLDAVANVSNSTTHTLELSNATTGLVTTSNVVVGKDLAVSGNATVSSNLTVSGNATVSSNLTVSGNATVTGDLNVSGALGILDAIYPVGTVIDRATAITDTHPNGKYKAFLAAPNQEWGLVSDGQDVVPLEYLTQEGVTTSFCQRATLAPATAAQSLDTSYGVITGTEITAFTPVLGTKKLKYEVSLQIHHQSGVTSIIGSFKFQVKVDSGSWTDVTTSVSTVHSQAGSGIFYTFGQNYEVIIDLDDIDDLSAGKTSAVRPVLGLRLVGREHNSSYQCRVHHVYWNYTVDNLTAQSSVFKPPVLELVSVGSEGILKYKRTV